MRQIFRDWYFFDDIFCMSIEFLFPSSLVLTLEGIFFLQADERYHEERNRAYISKWLRNPIRNYERFEVSMEGLKSFFKDVKVCHFLFLIYFVS